MCRIPTDKLLNTYIGNLKKGVHSRVESKAVSDKRWLKMFQKDMQGSLSSNGYTKQQYIDFIHTYLEPIVHNYYYTFNENVYDPVKFSITKVKSVYGFIRQDTGECCNFTIVKSKTDDSFTFKVQPLDHFNLPEWRV